MTLFTRFFQLPKAGRTGILNDMGTKSLLGILLALFLLSSCTMDSQTPPSGRIAEFPDVRLTEATYVLGRSGETPLSIEAQEIAIYEKTNQAILDTLVFTQKDAEGNLLLSGRADKAQVDTKTYDAQLSGNIQVRRADEDFSIEAEQLLWLNDEQVLSSEGDSSVLINFDGGQTIKGSGFKGNLKTATYAFTSLEEGVLHR